MYADDTVILAESEYELQNAINHLSNYCYKWNLEVNVEKTKIMIFSRGKVRKLPVFTYRKNVIEIVHEYLYLGILFNFNGKFNKSSKQLHDKGTRTMFAMLKQANVLNLDNELKLQLFESMVLPVAMYGCEVWGCYDLSVFEKLQLKFLKILLKLKTSTPSVMVYGECGKVPLAIKIKVRMISYWTRLISMQE